MINLHISISADTLTNIGPFKISNAILSSAIVSFFIIFLAIIVKSSIHFYDSKKLPSLIQIFFEEIINLVEKTIDGITGSKEKTKNFTPFFLAAFFFILLNNWSGLLPGNGSIKLAHNHSTQIEQQQDSIKEDIKDIEEKAENLEDQNHENKNLISHEQTEHHEAHLFRAGTSDFNTTLALALISVFLTQYWGVKYLGIKYFKKYIDPSNAINFFIGILEIIAELAKILSFSFRLFGNIFAGEVLLSVVGALVPIGATIPFYFMEVFVGLVQALVFAILSVVFFSMATHSHSEH